MATYPGSVLTIDLDAIAANWQSLDARIGDAECGAVVKANGYGLGQDEVSKALVGVGCRTFFVATLDEGIRLRGTIGPEHRIYVFNSLHGRETAVDFDAHKLSPVLNTREDIEFWSGYAQNGGRSNTVIEIDTGMNRLGLSPPEAEKIAEDAGLLAPLSLDFVMSHLACADEAADPMNEKQRQLFDKLISLFPDVPASLANSGGIFLGPGYHHDIARPGAALYGISEATGASEPMQQVVGLKAKILQIRIVDSESGVGYGASRRVPKGARLATVGVGYADGFLRSLGNSGHGYAAGIKVPVAGRISMDLTTFDVSDVPENRLLPGDHIDLICPEYSVDDIARDAGTIGYEILTSLGSRYTRVYEGGAA
ncbi:MAG: alanine racemase [Rhodospirillaceae bacterium]|jgi:alanine racemase|nr:alanine racemase [Rhodospirillaceae bacterium]